MEARVISNQNTFDEVLELLRVNKLPAEDIRLSNGLFISYHDDAGKIVGAGGLEFYSGYALLRSVVVDASMRGQSIGKDIVNDLLSRANQTSTRAVYLLTETAHDFFVKLGFSDIERDAVPSEVKVSTEFSTVCPVSASVMIYRIR